MYSILLLVIAGYSCAQNVPANVVEMAEKIDNNKVIQQVLRELITSNRQSTKNKPKLTEFSWTDCGQPTDLVVFSSLSLQPDPLTFPTTLNISVDATVKEDLLAPITTSLKVKKKEFGILIEIPCIDNYGSCTYDDLCPILEPLKDQCPEELKKYGLDCTCNISKNHYSVKDASFDVGSEPIPNGEYEVRAQLTHGGVNVLCLDLKFTIKKPDSDADDIIY